MLMMMMSGKVDLRLATGAGRARWILIRNTTTESCCCRRPGGVGGVIRVSGDDEMGVEDISSNMNTAKNHQH